MTFDEKSPGFVGQAPGLRRPLRPPSPAVVAPIQCGVNTSVELLKFGPRRERGGLRGRRRPRTCPTNAKARGSAGSALLAVLWLAAALSAIAFTVANTVRGETERTSTAMESLRCYYLAEAAIDRALLHIQWGEKYYKQPMPVMRFQFPSGEALVEIIPESAKLSVNRALAQDLASVVAAAGAPPDRASEIVRAIVDWRNVSPGGSFTAFDQYYLGLKPSFRARHASLEEIEELLLVQGMTPDLFYGRYERDAQGRLMPVSGLKDSLSVYGGLSGFDVNSVSPGLMRGIGISPNAVEAIVARRRAQPVKSMAEIAPLNDGGPGFAKLGLGVSPICTLRATARTRLQDGRLSEVTRSVSAMIRFLGLEYNPPYHVMRWYDSAYSPQ